MSFAGCGEELGSYASCETLGTCDQQATTGVGTGGTTQDTTTGGAPSGTTGDPAGPTTQKSGLPCDVQEIVYEHCASCHSDPPVSTFMPLLTQAHFQAQASSDPAKKYYEIAIDRVNADEKPMPPAVQSTLTADERATLTAWFEAGAPASDETCGVGLDGDGGVGPVEPPDDGREVDTTGLECHQFLAHAPGDKSTKFDVGVANDAYYNMIFDAPWEQDVYGVVVKPIIDNATVLHHWLLYKEPGAGEDGAVEESGGAHSGGELVHGWAPGGVALDFREHGDVAFELPSTTYVVEFHYNSADASAQDASGVEVCFKREPPEHVAGLSWLGLDHGAESYIAGELLGTWASGSCLFPSDEWVGTCDPVSNEPIHMMFVLPHMHEAGTHMKAVIDGPNGSRTLHDEPFDFDYQTSYEVDEVLMPGETITTTCSFSAPKCAGQATTAEMCYLYTYAYPKGALVDNKEWGSIAHGEGTCLGQ